MLVRTIYYLMFKSIKKNNIIVIGPVGRWATIVWSLRSHTLGRWATKHVTFLLRITRGFFNEAHRGF